MALLENQKLDPRLHNLAGLADDPDRLNLDRARGILHTAEPVPTEEVVPADALLTSALVTLCNGEIPPVMAHLRWAHLVENYYSVTIPVTQLYELSQQPEVIYIESARIFAPMLDTSVAEIHADELHPHSGDTDTGLDGTGVLVGIIDFDFDFTLDDFRHEDGTTRVAYFWNQWLTPQEGEQPPQDTDFAYGVEYDAAAIDQALSSDNPFEIIRYAERMSEESPAPLPSPGGHGTHVAGIAVGSGRSGDSNFPAGRYIGVAPGATIILVQPDAADATTSFTDSRNVANAIGYIYNRARELGMPCVINMSLGQNGGSHDGQSIVERAIDRWLDEPGRAFVSAAGNEHVWHGHASGSVATSETRVLRWKVGGGLALPGGLVTSGMDFTTNEMEIWYSSRDQFRVTVTAPSGEASVTVEPGELARGVFRNGDRYYIYSERFSVLNGDARIYIEIAPDSEPMASMAEGVWEVAVESITSKDGHFDAWIERDFRRRVLPWVNFSDQSFFLGTDFDHQMTLGTPATARRSIAVANYNHRAQVPHDTSSRGRTRDGREKPEVAAPGTEILSSHGLGGRSRSRTSSSVYPMRIAYTGTSMAAPHVAGVVALLFQHNPQLTAEQIQQILIASADPPQGIEPFDIAWGYGRVDARAAAELLG